MSKITYSVGGAHGLVILAYQDGSEPGLRMLRNGTAAGVMRLPTDPIGVFTLILANVVAGSAIRIETQAGALIEYRVADAATEVFAVPAYAAGNASNDLRVKVRKGTAAPFYKPLETLATAFVGSNSVFISQIPD